MHQCSTCKNLRHSVRKLGEPFGTITATLLRDAPAVVPDFVQRTHHRRPVVVAFKERNRETCARTLAIAFLAAVFLDVQLLNALAENANPLLGPANRNHVAYVESQA